MATTATRIASVGAASEQTVDPRLLNQRKLFEAAVRKYVREVTSKGTPCGPPTTRSGHSTERARRRATALFEYERERLSDDTLGPLRPGVATPADTQPRALADVAALVDAAYDDQTFPKMTRVAAFLDVQNKGQREEALLMMCLHAGNSHIGRGTRRRGL